MGGGGSKLRNKRVVIIGGGYGGMSVAMALKGKCQLTVIDPKDHFFHNIGALRACIDPGFTESIFIPYAPSLGNTFIQGKAKNLHLKDKKISLIGGQSVPYDYLVLATGSSGPFPGKLNKVAAVPDVQLATEMYKLMAEKIQTAEKIIIVGGGAVGVELACEIATNSPGKSITIIHSSQRGFIDGKRFSDKFRKSIQQHLTKLKVNVVLGERVVNMDELPKDGFGKCKVRTDARKTYDADLIFDCTGQRMNSDVYSDQLDDKMDSHDSLRVNNFLQVDGQTDIYAVGDCCNADELNTAHFAELHARVVVKNIFLAAAGKNYVSYKPGGPEMTITIGKNGGVIQSGSKKLKGNDLLVQKYWKLMEQIPPGKGAPQRAKTMKAKGNNKDQGHNQPVVRTKSAPARARSIDPEEKANAGQTSDPEVKAKANAPSGKNNPSGNPKPKRAASAKAGAQKKTKKK